MAYSYEDLNPTLIENTTMQKTLLNGVHRSYRITPISGYVLHDKSLDFAIDFEGVDIRQGYTTATCTCGANYDFAANPREFFAVLADSVPSDQIFGGDTDHEIM